MRLRSNSAMRGAFWCAAIGLGFLQAWSSRMNLVNDTISYLDIGDYILRGQWSMAVNGVWSPLYGCLLGLTLHIFHPSAYWEYPTVHLLLFMFFLFAAACFDFFLRELLLFHREQQSEAPAVPDWPHRATAYVLFLWSSFALIRVSETNPDMLVAAFFYLTCGLLVRIRRGTAQTSTYAGLGLALGLGYLTKAVMFPVSLLCLVAAFLIDASSRRRVSGAIIAALVFVVLSAPFIGALSVARGKLTFGEAGTYNFLVHVNHRPDSHWQGGDSDGERLLHSTRQIFDRPATFEFDGKPGGSYPVWFDPSYWYQGARPRVTLRQTVAALSANLLRLTLRLLIALNGALVACLFLMFYVSSRGRLILTDIGKFWFLLAPSIATLGLYAAVHIEMRYLAPFLVVALLSLWFSACLRPSPEASRLQSGAAMLLALMLISPIGPDAIPKNSSSLVELFKPLGAETNRNEEVASGLLAMGLRSGDRIASLEYSNCAVRLSSCEGAATWARLGGFRIVAEVYYWPENPATLGHNFWDADTVTQEKLVEALARSGAKVVVSRQKPRGAGATAWHQVANTAYYARWLVAPTFANTVSRRTPGPLTVCNSNPRYFCDPSGNVVYLAGDHTWSNFVDRGTIQPPPAFDYNGYMSFMNNHGFNWMRLWTKELANSSEVQDNFSPPPYKWLRTGPGTANDAAPKYDLSRLDQSYFDRMRSRILQAGQNGIYVSVMLFNGADWTGPNSTDGNPFESTNNVNGISCSGACPTNNSSIPALAWAYEKNYIHKVIDTVHDLPNAMYEVSNESPAASTVWQENVISELDTWERKTYGSHHPIGFTFQYPDGKDSTLWSSAADWISPAENVPGPSKANGRKVIINDTDHSYGYARMELDGPSGNIAWAWKNFSNGSGIAFMDPYRVVWPRRNNCPSQSVGRDRGICSSLDPAWDPIRLAIQDVLVYAKRMDLKNTTPQGWLSTSGFCLANPGSEYLVFSSSASFTLATVAGAYTFEWFNPSTHIIIQTGTVTVGNSQTFTAPFGGPAVLWLHK